MELHITSNADFDRLLTHSASMQRTMRKAVRRVLTKARQETQRAIRSALTNDPRAAYKAVRQTNYKQLFGGNISILSLSRAVDKRVMPAKTNLRQGAGGNRTRRSQRTEAMMTYYGKDRGFVLRFLNKGTNARQTKYGNRGNLPRLFDFQTIATQAVNRHLNEIQKQLDKDLS